MKGFFRTCLTIAAAACTCVPNGRTQPGSVDLSFDPGASVDFPVWPMAVQPDGKVIIGGGFFTPYPGIARLNVDGSLDKSFNPGPGLSPPGYVVGLSSVYSVAVQPDGKVLIGGEAASFTNRTGIARLNADGSLDLTFDPGTGAQGVFMPHVYSIVVQSDGKVLIGGSFTTYNGTNRTGIARLNANGSLDTSFNPGSGAGGSGVPAVNSIAVQSDGKVLIGGYFATVNGTNRNNIARLNSDGSLDLSFDPGTGANTIIESLALQPDGKVLVGGQFTTVNGTNRNRIARLNADGSLDTGFTAPAIGGTLPYVYSVAESGGKVLIGGNFTFVGSTSRNRIARLNDDGSLDMNFDPGTGANAAVRSVVVQSNGKALIGGSFASVNGAGCNFIARLETNGTLDGSFNPGSSEGRIVYSVALQPDGKALVGGSFTNFNRVARQGVARLNDDGSLDTGFNPDARGYLGGPVTVYSVTTQPDGKVLIGGNFSSVNGTIRNGLARLNKDGGLDNGYNPALPAFSTVYSVAVQTNGKALIGGSFTTFTFTNRNLGRLNDDGNLDNSFQPGAGANGIVRAIVVQPDGKVLIGGEFTSYNGTNRNGIARLNADGSLDTSFNPGSGVTGGFPNAVHSIALQPDGKVLVGGEFTTVNGLGRDSIARFNADGTGDTNFLNAGTGAHLEVRSVALQPDGKVLIGGEPFGHIARLNVNGTRDTSFNPGIGTTAPVTPFVYALTVQPDGKVLIGGGFTAVNGAARWWVARLHGDAPLLYPGNNTSGLLTLNWGAISGRTYRVQVKPDLNATNWTDLSPDITATTNRASKNDPITDPQRYYRVCLLP